uniref:Uncharacterized protein n=1 Tax=Cannabis sativa TaxID=3483 RepID=A0A803R849_CANSA
MFSPYLQLLRVSNLCIYKYSYSLLRFLQNCVDFICVCVTSLDIVGRLIKNSNQGTSMVHEYLKAPHQVIICIFIYIIFVGTEELSSALFGFEFADNESG